MSKSKTKSSKSVTKPETTVLNKAKDAAVKKPAQTPKAKSKEIAKQVAAKEEKKSKKKVKEPTPEPESESETESESEFEESASSESESVSESEAKVATKKGAAKGKAPVKATTGSKGKDSEDDSDEESESSESSDDEPAATNGAGKTAPAVNGETNPAAESSEESDSSDSDEEMVDEKPVTAKQPVSADQLTKKVIPVASKKTSDDESDESDESEESDEESEASDDSSEESSEDNEEVEPKRAASKRKAEEEAAPAMKKAKTGVDTNESQGKNLFVGSLSWNVDEEWLRSEFQEFGELTGVRLITDRNTGRSKGFGYVEFANAADAAAAHAAKQGAELDGRKINVDFATSRTSGDQKDKFQSRAKTYGDQTGDPTDTLWVGNISFQVDEDQISTAFQEYGTILGVRLPTDRETGAPKGFGYVTYSSVDEAKAAMEAMQGADLAGRSLRLDYSQPRQNNGDSPARGGRGGGRGGFGDRGRGGRGGGRGFGDRGGRGGGRGNARGGRGASTNRGGFGDFSGKKTTF